MNTRRMSTLALATAMLMTAFSCKESKKPVVTVQCSSFTEDFQRAIELQCPDIEIKWFLSTQSHHNFFSHLEVLPDILSVGSFYADEKPAPYLMDISSFVKTSDYSKNVIDNFRNTDGSVFWIPVIGNSYFILANKALFEKYGIAYPKDYESLISADREFKKNGVDGMAWGLGRSWQFVPMLVAQVLAADMFNSYDGMLWKKNLQSSAPSDGYTLDEVLWPEVLKRFEDAFGSGLIDSTDFQDSNVAAMDKVRFGDAAMTLCSSNNLTLMKDGYEVIPFFDSNGLSWVPIYISTSFAVSNKVSDDRLPSVIKVLDAIQSSNSMKAYNESRKGAFPLRSSAEDLPQELAPLTEPMEKGYSFLLFNDMSSGIVEGINRTVREMFDKKLSAADAYALCKDNVLLARKAAEKHNEWIGAEDTEHILFTSDVSYPLTTDCYHNNPAASCLANTALASINSLSPKGFDIMVTLPSFAGSPIQQGPYHLDESGKSAFNTNMYFMFNARRSVYPAYMKVSDLIQYLNNSFYYFHRIDDGLPVMAGGSYIVDKYENGISDDKLPFKPGYVNAGDIANHANFPTRYVCKAIIKDGAELPLNQIIRVLIARENAFYMTESTKEFDSQWVGLDTALQLEGHDGKMISNNPSFVIDWLKKGEKLCPPTRYLIINEKEELK